MSVEFAWGVVAGLGIAAAALWAWSLLRVGSLADAKAEWHAILNHLHAVQAYLHFALDQLEERSIAPEFTEAAKDALDDLESVRRIREKIREAKHG